MSAPMILGSKFQLDKLEKLCECQRRIGYHFRNQDLLWEALQQTNAISGLDLPEGNKGLAHYGDAALNLYTRREGRMRGLSVAKTHALGEHVKQNAKLDRAGRERGIDRCINLNAAARGKVADGGKVVADAVEAIIGAVFWDSGDSIAVTAGVIEALGLRLPDEELSD